ncbi:MAG TPA: ATP-binding protein [Myxococcota bacterium]|nr:ATP-binding protein [Myxococcota bacterium]
MDQPGVGDTTLVAALGPDASPSWLRVAGERLREAEIARVGSAAECQALARSRPLDAAVVDARVGAEAEALVAWLAARAIPSLVLEPAGSDSAALAWLRAGAGECLPCGANGERIALALRRLLARERARRDALRREAASDVARAHRDIVEQLNSALLVVDATGRIAYCNPPAEQILGAGFEALHGREASDWFEPAGEGDETLIARSLRSGARFKGAEAVVTRPDGRRVPVGMSCAPIESADGTRSGVVAVFQDLSDVKQLRTQLLQHEKLASIGELAAGVAHEINNPMGFIHANLFQMAEYVQDLRRVFARVEALAQAASKSDSAELREVARALAAEAEAVDVEFVLGDLAKAVRESQEGSERIRHIVQDLRDFSHPDASERVLADLNQCLDSTANIVWPMMKHAVVLEKRYAELPVVSCFPMQLKQVFMNLLVNAYQAIEEAVGRSGETGTIALETARHGDVVRISVRDSGVGISAEHRERIFDPFFTTKKVGAGTGLGLSTSFGIVQRHGGRLTVESEPGRGSAFHVFLPVGEEGDTGE